MLIHANRDELLRLTKQAALAVPKNTELPQLRGIHMEANARRSMLTLTATNQEIAIQTSMSAVVEETGSMVIDAELMPSILALLPEENLDRLLQYLAHILPHCAERVKAIVPVFRERAGRYVHRLLYLRPCLFLKVVFAYNLSLLFLQLINVKFQLLYPAPQSVELLVYFQNRLIIQTVRFILEIQCDLHGLVGNMAGCSRDTRQRVAKR